MFVIIIIMKPFLHPLLFFSVLVVRSFPSLCFPDPHAAAVLLQERREGEQRRRHYRRRRNIRPFGDERTRKCLFNHQIISCNTLIQIDRVSPVRPFLHSFRSLSFAADPLAPSSPCSCSSFFFTLCLCGCDAVQSSLADR